LEGKQSVEDWVKSENNQLGKKRRNENARSQVQGAETKMLLGDSESDDEFGKGLEDRLLECKLRKKEPCYSKIQMPTTWGMSSCMEF
jgi:hypothetical protein